MNWLCWGKYEFWESFQSNCGSCHPFLVETSGSSDDGWSWDTTEIKTHTCTCSHIRRALPTTHLFFTLVQHNSPHLLALWLVIGFCPSSAQGADSRIPEAQHFSGSLFYELALANVVHWFVTIQSIFVHLSYIRWKLINLRHYYYHQWIETRTDWFLKPCGMPQCFWHTPYNILITILVSSETNHPSYVVIGFHPCWLEMFINIATSSKKKTKQTLMSVLIYIQMLASFVQRECLIVM